MKQKDIAIITLVGFISALISLFISSKLFASPKNRHEKVEIVNSIKADFNKLDPRYFNSQAVNPTKLITVTPNSNNTPFNTKTP